jgi:TolA-binding protein
MRVAAMMILSLGIIFFIYRLLSGPQNSKTDIPTTVARPQVEKVKSDKDVAEPEELITVAEKEIIKISKKTAVMVKSRTKYREVKNLSGEAEYTVAQGEATFSVEKDGYKSFKVSTPHLDVNVTGTVFKVQVLADHSIVSVLRGSVEVVEKAKEAVKNLVTAGREISSVDPVPKPRVINPVAKREMAGELKEITRHIQEVEKVMSPSRSETKITDPLDNLRTLIQKDELDKAYSEFLSRVPDRPQAAAEKLGYALATKFLRKRDNEKARAILERIIESGRTGKTRENALYQHNLIMLERVKDIEVAEKGFNRYLDEYPEGDWRGETIYRLTQINIKKKSYSRAVFLLEQYVNDYRGEESYRSALYDLATLMREQRNNPDRAAYYYKRYAAEYGKTEEAEPAMYWMAECYYKTGKKIQALEAYKKYLKTYPKGKYRQAIQERMRFEK